MVSIYERFSKDLIHVNDDYTSHPAIHTLKNLLFQVDESNENDFLTPVGIQGNKIQSILNKQFHYVPERMGASSGVEYSKHLFDTYKTLSSCLENSVETVKEPVFYFMDFESVNGTVHSYDLLFYLLYIYKTSGLQCRLVIPNSCNLYFKKTIELIKDYYTVEFLEIKYGKPYLFECLYCIRSYMNTFFLEVKEFVNTTLIDPILEKYKRKEYSNTVGKVKVLPKGSIRSLNAVFPYSSEFSEACIQQNIFLFDDTTPEDLKIYYMNNAENVIVCWGSIFYIYIDYYLKSTKDKFISVLFHKAMMPEKNCLVYHNGSFYQQMNQGERGIQQVYNTLRFQGEIIDNIDSLSQYIHRSLLFKS
jgi:hypothetical protein